GPPRPRADPASCAALRTAFPGAPLAGCSTAGEINGTTVRDGTLSVTAVRFEHTRVRCVRRAVPERSQSRDAARALARELAGDELVSVFVLSDGLQIDGQELVAGLAEAL